MTQREISNHQNEIIRILDVLFKEPLAALFPPVKTLTSLLEPKMTQIFCDRRCIEEGQ